MKRILFLLIFVFFNFKLVFAIDLENLSEATEELEKVQKEISQIKSSNSETAKSIDSAVQEINKATDFVKETLARGNIDDAVNTLEFIEKSLGDVTNLVQPKITSDMTQIDTESFGENKLNEVLSVTKAMNANKEENLSEMISNMSEIQNKGLNVKEITSNLKELGIKTIELEQLDIAKIEEMKKWDKNQWANSYKGSILTSTGDQVITDKEISAKVVELEGKFQENTLSIESKRFELANLNSELNPINSELESLNEKKSLLTSQYNLELSKLSVENLSELETQKSLDLSQKLKNEIESITNEVLQAEQKSSSLKAEILSINNSLNEEILASNNLRADINSLNENKLELTDAIALRTAKLNELKGQSSELNSNSDIAQLTAKLDESEKLKTQLTDLQSEIENKSLAVSEKISEVNNLNSQLDPLSNQIKSLQERKEGLQNQYNLEISNISNSFNNSDLVKSQDLAANLNNEINSVTNEIKNIEANSSQIKTDISQLNLEINTERNNLNQITLELVNSQKDLDKTLDIISSKELQLDRLKNADLVQVNQQLNEQLSQVSLQKDFIEVQFEKSINKEVEALQRYYSALGDIDSEYFDEEVEFAIREVGVILDSDPKKAAAFEFEKWATYAGLSKDFIQQATNAVNNDDWDAQKQIYKDITKALAKSPDWQVDVPSNAELNVMIAEEKAIHEAVLTLNESRKVQEQVDKIISERTLQYQDDASIDLQKVSLAFTRVDGYGNLTAVIEGKEGKLVVEQFNEILSNNQELSQIQKSLEEKNDLYSKILEENKAYGEMINQYSSEISKINNQVWEAQAEINKVNFEKNKYLASINEADPTVWGGIALLNRGQGLPDHSKWTKTVKEFDQRIGELNQITTVKSTEAWNKVSEKTIAMQEFKTSGDQRAVVADIRELEAQSNEIKKEVAEVARENVVNLQKKAVEEINKVRNEEIAKTGGLYNTAEEINKILDDIPSFDTAKRERVNEVLTGINASWGYQVNVGDKAAALRAALGNQNDYEAYKAAVKAMSEIGKAPVNKYMTGPYWEMTNVKAAAIVRSKKYDWVDDYAYSNAYYEEPLELNTANRQYVESELKNLLGNNNPKLNTLNKQANALKSEIETNNLEISNLNSNISKLENEITSIKSSEQNLKNQISKLNNDLTSKQSIIDGKNKSLSDLQKNLDPINNKISELESRKNDLNNSIQNQINLISQNTKKSEEIAQKTLELENKLSKEITEIDQQINGYKKETKELNVNISNLNNEILNLESEKPDLSNKISKINEELTGYANVKAELSVLNAEQKVEVANIDLEVNKLESELKNLKASESQINQQLASLSNELKSKENIIKNNNLSIAEIQKQIDPLNNQMQTLESQKVSLNQQFNKDLAELSSQIEKTTETNSVEIDKLKADFESQISKLDKEITNFESQANELNSTVTALNDEIKSIEVETPQISNQIAKLNQDIKDFTNIKADLAIAEAKKANMVIEDKLVNSIAQLENKSVIKIAGSDTLRIVDTDLLIDNSGNFKVKNTLTVNGNVYTAGAVQPQHLFSFENIDETGDLKIEYSKEAIAQLSEAKEITETTQISNSTVGSWVLVDAKTGKQMVNPTNGHSGSIVCDLGTCGSKGAFGQQAATFGGVYVLENLANPNTGNVAGRCASGDCQFNFDNANKFSAEVSNLSEETKSSIDASRAVVSATQSVTDKTLSGTKDVAKNVVAKLESISSAGFGNSGRLQQTINEINQSQAAAASAIASGTADIVTHAMSTQSASSAIAGALARDMVQGASNEVNATSQQLSQAKAAVASAATEAQKAAAEVQQASAQAAAEAARAALSAAQEATQEIQQAAHEAQAAAKDVVAGISGNDIEALSQIPNDALGVWQEVDASGKAVNDQQIVCQASTCGAHGSFGKAAAARGNSYVRTNRTGGY